MTQEVNKEIIHLYLKTNDMSIKAFCKECDISQNTYRKIMSNKNNYRLNALLKIAKQMKIELKDLFFPLDGEQEEQ